MTHFSARLFQQLRDVDPQRLGDFLAHAERWIMTRRLKASEVRATDPCRLNELLLRQAALLSDSLNPYRHAFPRSHSATATAARKNKIRFQSVIGIPRSLIVAYLPNRFQRCPEQRLGLAGARGAHQSMASSDRAHEGSSGFRNQSSLTY
jgi:hypothetical protein